MVSWAQGTGGSATLTSGSGGVWPMWVDSSTTATAGNSWGDNNTIWITWVSTGTCTTGADLTWTSWATSDVQTYQGNYRRAGWRDRLSQLERIEAGMTPEERAAKAQRIEEQRKAREIEREQRMKKREAAILKAEMLLRSCLTVEQERMLDADRCFEVVGGDTGTKYRVRRGRAINVEVLGARGAMERKLCFHPRADVPDADAMLCQKLMLETCEKDALRIANVHSVHTREMTGEDRIVPRERREEIIAEVIPIRRAA